MEQEYTKDYFWEVYKQLPEELKDALFSDKNNELISHICAQAGLNEEQVSVVAKYTGRVIMGLLPLEELPITIELELNISQDLASQINRQIYTSVFKHLRVSLNKINNKNSEYRDSFTSSKDGVLEKEEAPVKTYSKPQPFVPHPTQPEPKIIRPEAPKETIPPTEKGIAEEKPSNKDIFIPHQQEPEKSEPLPDNPVFAEKPADAPPKIPTRDAFKNSLEHMDIENIDIPMPSMVKNKIIPNIPPIEEVAKTPSIPPQPERPPVQNNSDPYKETPI